MRTMTADQIGRFAELLAAATMSRPVGGSYRRPLFRATHLGEKYPTVDLIVDLLGPNDVSRGFFFAQVKGTTAAKATDVRLAIDVPHDRFNRLVRLTAPTYLIGVDLVNEASYLVAAHRARRTRVSSMTKVYPLNDEAVKMRLYKEVLAFWEAHKPLLLQTGFIDV